MCLCDLLSECVLVISVFLSVCVWKYQSQQLHCLLRISKCVCMCLCTHVLGGLVLLGHPERGT